MYRRRQLIGVPLVALALCATPAVAQLNSVAIVYSPPPGEEPAVSLYAFYGKGGNDSSGRNSSGTLLGSIGLGKHLVVGAALGVLRPEDSSGERTKTGQGMVSASGNIRPYLSSDGATAVYLGAQLGAGFSSLADDASEVAIPFGLAAALSAHLAGLSFEVWLMPRYAAYSVSVQSAKVWQHGPGISTGLTLGIPAGFSLLAAFDWSNRSEETDAGVTFSERSPFVWTVGARYRFR